jgi:hypothetical protein
MNDDMRTPDELFLSDPVVSAALKDGQKGFWTMQPSTSGVEPPVERPEDEQWKHTWRESLEVIDAKVYADERTAGRWIYEIAFKCVTPGSINLGKSMRCFYRMDPPAGGDFNIMTKISMSNLESLVLACDKDFAVNSAGHRIIAKTIRENILGGRCSAIIKRENRYSAKNNRWYDGQEVAVYEKEL